MLETVVARAVSAVVIVVVDVVARILPDKSSAIVSSCCLLANSEFRLSSSRMQFSFAATRSSASVR